MEIKDAISVAIIGLAGYVGYKLFKIVEDKTGGLTDLALSAPPVMTGKYLLDALKAGAKAGDAIRTGLFDVFFPGSAGETIYYTPTFPDGQRHAIPGSTVESDGKFQYQNVWYRLLTGKDGLRYAAPL